MISAIGRRNFFSCGACSIFSLGIATSAVSQDQFYLGCGIDDNAMDSLRTADRIRSPEYMRSLFADSSGNSDFDRALGFVLTQISQDFGVYPEFFFYDDGGYPQARASRSKLDSRGDGTVIFGETMLKNALLVEGGDAAVLAICAHEFAHIAAYKREDQMRLALRGKPRYARELHADFLAGYFMAKYRKQFPQVNLAAAGSIWLGFGSTDPTKPGSHGTIAMRREAINSGYFLAEGNRSLQFESAFAAATNFIGAI